MAKGKQRFTVFDMLDNKGVFDENSANASSGAIYKPQEYPKMLYHPMGEQRVTNPAEIIVTPIGPKSVNEQKELIYKIVNNAEEEKALLEAGWHDHPSKANEAGGREGAPVSELERAQAEIKRLTLMVNDANTKKGSGSSSPAKQPGATIVPAPSPAA